jgi:hypothetical protein
MCVTVAITCVRMLVVLLWVQVRSKLVQCILHGRKCGIQMTLPAVLSKPSVPSLWLN